MKIIARVLLAIALSASVAAIAAELHELEWLAEDGLVEFDGEWIQVTPTGRLLVRVVCAVFDKYLRATQERSRYSRVV